MTDEDVLDICRLLTLSGKNLEILRGWLRRHPAGENGSWRLGEEEIDTLIKSVCILLVCQISRFEDDAMRAQILKNLEEARLGEKNTAH